MTDEFDGLLWAYRAVFKQTAAGGGNIVVKVTAMERMIVLYGVTGPNDYAADRTVNCVVNDENDSQIGRILASTPVDNEQLPLISSATSVGVFAPHHLNERLVLGAGDSMVITAAALAQNEELTLAIRALMRSWPADISTATSGGTVTTTTTYNKVI